MRLHYLQHVAFEGLGSAEAWASERAHEVSATRLWAGEPPPASPEAFDLLVVLGGPMGVGDERHFPFLADEKRAVERAIRADRTVLGICLGAQVVADVLGARVAPNAEEEIGWFPVERAPGAEASPLGACLPERFTPFHWHADAFAIPEGAVRLASSAACANQAFAYGDRVLALQFHPEITPAGLDLMLANEPLGAAAGPYVQTPERMRSARGELTVSARLMHALLDALAARR